MTEKRLLPVSGKQMVKVFIKVGFHIDRQRGSHIVMSKGDAMLVIPPTTKLFLKERKER